MKGYFLILSCLLFFLGKDSAWAGGPSPAVRQAPVDPQGNYFHSLGATGVDVATSAFSSGFTTASVTGPCYALGVYFSSGSVADYADIYSSGGWTAGSLGGVSTPTYRVFNTAISSSGITSPGTSAGFVPLNGGVPVKLGSSSDGCGFRPSSNGYHTINLHFWAEKK